MPEYRSHPLETGCPPEWASEWGSDIYGPFLVFEVESVSQWLRWIPAGSFLMGSPQDEPGRFEREGPQHPVTLSRGYFLAETPCTQALWEVVMGGNPSRFQSPERPVENVSWDDCQGFITRLNALLPGLSVRLPTEAEWEYACRAGRTVATYAGPMTILGEHHAPVLDPIAWYGGNSGRGYELKTGADPSNWKARQYEDAVAGTHPVCLKSPNRWGLHDTLGNVDEWCADHFGDYPNGPVTDPTGPEGGSGRVYRGGSWLDRARVVRAAFRDYRHEEDRSHYLGFRLARDPDW